MWGLDDDYANQQEPALPPSAPPPGWQLYQPAMPVAAPAPHYTAPSHIDPGYPAVTATNKITLGPGPYFAQVPMHVASTALQDAAQKRAKDLAERQAILDRYRNPDAFTKLVAGVSRDMQSTDAEIKYLKAGIRDAQGRAGSNTGPLSPVANKLLEEAGYEIRRARTYQVPEHALPALTNTIAAQRIADNTMSREWRDRAAQYRKLIPDQAYDIYTYRGKTSRDLELNALGLLTAAQAVTVGDSILSAIRGAFK